MPEPKIQTASFRNPVRLEDGRIDLEIEHPRYGWIPFTADANDVEVHGRAIWAEVDAYLRASGGRTPSKGG